MNETLPLPTPTARGARLLGLPLQLCARCAFLHALLACFVTATSRVLVYTGPLQTSIPPPWCHQPLADSLGFLSAGAWLVVRQVGAAPACSRWTHVCACVCACACVWTLHPRISPVGRTPARRWRPLALTPRPSHVTPTGATWQQAYSAVQLSIIAARGCRCVGTVHQGPHTAVVSGAFHDSARPMRAIVR
jgi:hypothetical protein